MVENGKDKKIQTKLQFKEKFQFLKKLLVQISVIIKMWKMFVPTVISGGMPLVRIRYSKLYVLQFKNFMTKGFQLKFRLKLIKKLRHSQKFQVFQLKFYLKILNYQILNFKKRKYIRHVTLLIKTIASH